ncbi:MAG TPA: IS1595 family transposase [Steroidobacteraceae bacterium]|nr:IS1595 family transposase [Steroidobacteraceae bacterium]
MSSILNAPWFHDEAAAYEYVERHLWPTGPVCPHCGNCDGTKIGRLNGKTTRIGLRKCYECRQPFTVKMGTIFEDSHAPMRFWLQAIYLMCSSKKGISTRQLQRTLGVGMKTAWFMGHRIRHAMAPEASMGPVGGPGKTVEADETYLSKSPKTRKAPGTALNAKPAPQVFSLVERGGNVRSMYLDDKNIRGALDEHLHRDSRLVTDGSQVYRFQVQNHEFVDHSKYEWSRGDVHTNTLEGFFSIFKRGLVGIYQHMDKKHLDRYLAEFDFRMNTRAKLNINDVQRTAIAVAGFKGKRLMYKTAH